MTRATVTRATATRGVVAPDGGFTLLEVVVAMSLFAVAATVILGLLLRTTDAARTNIRRSTAANLAQRQIETARALSATAIPDGQSTTTPTVNGTTYTVTQVANYVPTDSSTSVCTGSGNTLAYKLVTVTVSWPDMGSVQPVRADTLKAVGLGTNGLDASKGTLAVQVTGASGAAQAGIVVTLGSGPQTRTTGDDGCAVFAGLAPGTYSVSASTSGYAGTDNTRLARATGLGVNAGGITRGSLPYDRAATLDVGLDVPGAAAVPAGLVLRMGDTYLPEYTLPACTGSDPAACATGVPGTVTGLFPETYSVTVGTCTETTPSSVSIDLKTAPGDPPSVGVPLGAVAVTVQTPLGIPVADRAVSLVHAAGCAETFAATSVAGGGAVALPYGTWTVRTTDAGTGLPVSSPPVTLDPTTRTAAVTLVVTS